jgi:predicted dehydrogenase
MKHTRRDFIQKTSSLVAAASLGPMISYGSVSANEKLTVGLIGCKGMGFYNLEDHLRVPGIECAALCDVDENILNARAADVQKITGKAPKLYKDYRKLLEDKSIDVVIIGTPDHWHCLPMVEACEAGKDVYVEKPLANSIAECEVMVKAARKYNRVVQVGQQQRSGAHWKEAMEMIRSGKLGQLRKVNIWANFNYGIGQPVVADEAVPAGVDFDRWLGPAPKRSFNKTRFHGSWRMFWDYGGGLTSDWGVHLIDMALWPKDIKTAPLSVTSSGSNFAYADHAHETFDTQTVTFQMKDYLITWEHTAGTETGPYGRNYGLAFVCNDATLVINREGYELFPEQGKDGYKVPAIPKRNGYDSHLDHVKNFIDCVKTRKETACPIENGRLVALYAHMANISARTQSRVVWDEAAKNFGDNTEANALITPAYRAPWKLPVI